MDWERLKKFECPHCWQSLKKEGEDINCTSCKFTMSESRFKTRMTRHEGKGPKVNWKWQNLHKDLCIMCSNRLAPVQGKDWILKCLTCPFSIRVDKVEKILKDASHSANRYKDKL